MTFKVGDIVTSTKWADMGNGEVLTLISDHTLGVRFEGYDAYQDDHLEDSDYPDLPDFHYVAIKHCSHVVETFQYNPEQTGDTEDDI